MSSRAQQATPPQTVAPIIPSSTPSAAPGSVPGAVRGPLPLTDPSTPPSTPPGTTYAMARVDPSGRVTDRTITAALHWHPGDPLTITVTTGVVLIQRDPNGLLVLPTKPCISIPAAIRHRLRVATGDRLLLAANPGDDQLMIYPLAAVHHALTGQRPEGGARP